MPPPSATTPAWTPITRDRSSATPRRALIYLAQAFGIDHEDLEETYPRLFEQPFDSDRKRMTTVHRIQDRNIAYTKGAVDEMLPLYPHAHRGRRPAA
ncbi:MAG: hypothetical protein ACLR1T_13140 [Evtepia gabavorous]